MSEQKPIGVIGVGWVGLVTASCFADLGHSVVAMDIDAAKVEALGNGEAPIHEPGIEELLDRNRERLRFTTDMAEALDAARLLFCCVDTPPTHSGDADLSRVQAVVSRLGGDGDQLRLVGWKTDGAAYWVDNTLLGALTPGQMLGIAESMRKLTG